MFDYISALCMGESLRTPATDPLDGLPAPLRLQMEQITLTMGGDFAQSLFRQLRGFLTHTEQTTYRDGFQTGAQLMLAMLEDIP